MLILGNKMNLIPTYINTHIPNVVIKHICNRRIEFFLQYNNNKLKFHHNFRSVPWNNLTGSLICIYLICIVFCGENTIIYTYNADISLKKKNYGHMLDVINIDTDISVVDQYQSIILVDNGWTKLIFAKKKKTFLFNFLLI